MKVATINCPAAERQKPRWPIAQYVITVARFALGDGQHTLGVATNVSSLPPSSLHKTHTFLSSPYYIDHLSQLGHTMMTEDPINDHAQHPSLPHRSSSSVKPKGILKNAPVTVPSGTGTPTGQQ